MRKFFSTLAICLAILMVFSISSLAEEVNEIVELESVETISDMIEPEVPEEELELGSIDEGLGTSDSVAAYVGSLSGVGTNGDFYSSGTFTISAHGASGNKDYLRVNSYTTSGASTLLVEIFLGTSTSGTLLTYDLITVTSSDTDIKVPKHNNGNSSVTDICTYTIRYTVAPGSAIVNAHFVQK